MTNSNHSPAGLDGPIEVEGYSPRFVAAARVVLGIEGGYANDRADRGGETNFGISLRFLAAEGHFDADGDGKADFDLDMDGDIDGADIRALTRGDSMYLYHRCFWLRLQAETFPAPIGEMMFDQAINGGLQAARKLLQRAINTCALDSAGLRERVPQLGVDGKIGNATRHALLAVLQWPGAGMPALVRTYRDAARERYRAIARRYPSQQRNLRGWLVRADRLGR